MVLRAMNTTNREARNALALVKPGAAHSGRVDPLFDERRWLHDHTLQVLEYLAAGGYDALDVGQLRSVAGRAADELRCHVESAPVDPHDDLAVALREVVADAQMLSGGVTVELLVAPRRAALVPREVGVLTDAVREALNNVRKHAKATAVVVRCRGSANGAVVTVADNGVGFSAEGLNSGTGVRQSLIGRMLACGGTASIQRRPKGGTLVTLTIRRRRAASPAGTRATRKSA
jgi:signal transduction histidine kinase